VSTTVRPVRPVPAISRRCRRITDKNYVSECGHVFIPDAFFGHKLMNTGVKDTVYCDDCDEWFPARIATLREVYESVLGHPIPGVPDLPEF
jgi:hypothetical protein